MNRCVSALSLFLIAGLASTPAASQSGPSAIPMPEQGTAPEQRMTEPQGPAAPRHDGEAEAGPGTQDGPRKGRHEGRGPKSDRNGHAGLMRLMFILADTDGDGALSLEEVQTIHARIFKEVDADADGKATIDEMQGFMRSLHGGERRGWRDRDKERDD